MATPIETWQLVGTRTGVQMRVTNLGDLDALLKEAQAKMQMSDAALVTTEVGGLITIEEVVTEEASQNVVNVAETPSGVTASEQGAVQN